jgi:hypothetical protein
LGRGGYSEDDIRPRFESVDDLVIAIAERRQAFLTSLPQLNKMHQNLRPIDA